MKELQNKIRNEIAKSYYLRNLAKDDKLLREKVIEIYEEARKHDKKIIFLKNFKKALEEQNETKTNNRRF